MRIGILALSLTIALSGTGPALAAGVVIGGQAGGGAAGTDADEAQRRQIAAAVGSADLVAVVKVVDVVEPKKDGDEEKEKKGEDAGAANNGAGVGVVMFGGLQGGAEKTIRAEVTELLRGEGAAKDAKAVAIKAQVMSTGKREQLLITVDREFKTPDGNVARRFTQQTSVPFTLEKGKSSLVFLKLDGERKDADGKVVERFYKLVPPVLDGAPEKALAAAREALKQIAEWNSPPKLADGERAAVEQLIKQLGDDAFETREAATKALIARGAAVKELVEAAARSDDPEIKQRAEQVIEAVKPESLKPQDQTNAWPGGGAIMMQNGGVQVQMRQMAE